MTKHKVSRYITSEEITRAQNNLAKGNTKAKNNAASFLSKASKQIVDDVLNREDVSFEQFENMEIS